MRGRQSASTAVSSPVGRGLPPAESRALSSRSEAAATRDLPAAGDSAPARCRRKPARTVPCERRHVDRRLLVLPGPLSASENCPVVADKVFRLHRAILEHPKE